MTFSNNPEKLSLFGGGCNENDRILDLYGGLLVLDRGFWPPSLHAREWKFNKPGDEGAALAAQKEDAAPWWTRGRDHIQMTNSKYGSTKSQ